ncbi:TBC1 domain family member 2 [Nematocida major]|uniref:TBC1 domain family member 2 n=1 Tax=Nematocida major TaxID=1912982 RepID=UPI002008026A|nr:TBC1 domain family member 2 [Nematocida major]KAH9385896.1 TBC1 domain family member 2 [Nematocida major]
MQHPKNAQTLREKAWNGLHEKERGIVWLVLLDVISPCESSHESEIQARIKAYLELSEEETFLTPDFLLSPSNLNKAYKQIQKDVLRIKSTFQGTDISDRYIKAMQIFTRKHSVIGYAQGMCEIFKLFIDVYAVGYSVEEAEALSYFCFTKIVCTYLDYFSSRQAGIERSIFEIQVLIKKYAPDLERHFSREGVEVKYFAYNWVSTFLIREFMQHKEVFDAHFSLGPEEFVRFNEAFSAGIIFHLSGSLLESDFEGIIRTLQNLQDRAWSRPEIEKLLSIGFVIYSGGRLW